MIGFIKYQLLSYIRSYRFIAPVASYIAWVILTYTYSGVPILSSYATTSLALFIIMTWVSMTVFSLEEISEKHILYTKLKRKQTYIRGKIVICMIITFCLFLFGLLYPLVMQSFAREMNSTHYGLSFYSHVSLGGFGVLVGAFISIPHLSASRYSWLLSALVVTVSIAHNGIVDRIPSLKWVLLIFPPVTNILTYLNAGDQLTIGGAFWFSVLGVLTYLLVSFIVIEKLFVKLEK